MQTILVAGATGVGKTTLLSRLAGQRKMTVIDPFIEGAKTWADPKTGSRGGVVIDHIHYLPGAKAIVTAAAVWCERHAVPNLRNVGYSDEQLALFSTALENTGAKVFVTSEATSQASAEYVALRLSDAEVPEICAPNARRRALAKGSAPRDSHGLGISKAT
ncbi:hypothetical protein HHL24_26570 [Paraburkholderia sp. RP-4-7]|jgi:ABC-type transport system involved in cytochrome c biogenesis ATPase subunit|uniref:Uncharacterized protein n=1 Tax=Paraburkholderia polaris TaxID=2728848 RepID=A0A848IMS9_9BURK|nr:hypothetical protein [Paraburkholderia polaris]NMM01489.1 hypothetical protein [Paraburkholderia polaris]